MCTGRGGGIGGRFADLSHFFNLIFLAHLSCSDKVSFCDRSSSVVVRSLTIDLNDNSS